MSIKKKNTYKATEVNEKGGLKHGANIHAVTVKINYYVWDMIKILNQNNLYGFHFEANISVKRTIIVLTHQEKEMLPKARAVLKSFHNDEDILFLLKVAKEKKNNHFRAFIQLLLLMGLGSGLVYGGVHYFFKNFSLEELLHNDNKREKQASSDEIITQKVEIDIEKLKALKSAFKEESYVKDMKKMMEITTDVISATVSDEEKAKYSSDELVKNFKGKSGIEFVLKESNSTTFKKDVEELNEYAMGFVKENNVSLALGRYNRTLAKKSIKKDEKALTLSNQAQLYKEINDLKQAKEGLEEAKDIYMELAKKEFNKFSPALAWTWTELADLEENFEKQEMFFKEIEKIYKKRVKHFRQLSRKNPKKYKSQLAWSLNLLANFYENKMHLTEKSMTCRLEAKVLYAKMFKQAKYAIALDYFKTLNSLGSFYLKEKELSLAKKEYREALGVVKKMLPRDKEKYQPYLALSLNNLALLHTEERAFKEAEGYYAEALQIYAKLVKRDFKIYKILLLNLHSNLANHYAEKKDFLEAKERYAFVLFEYKKMQGDINLAYNFHIARTLNGLAKVSLLEGKKKSFFQARQYLIEALSFSKDIIFEGTEAIREVRAKSYFYLATSYYSIGQEKRAENYYLEAVKLINSFEIESKYASFLAETKQYLKARRLYDTMLLKYKNQSLQAKIWMRYGEFYVAVSPEGARERLLNALKIYKKMSKKREKPYVEIEKIEKLLEEKRKKDS